MKKDLISTEQVSRWHPDKVADQISDAIVSEILQRDGDAHCGVEVMVKGDFVMIGGEISADADEKDINDIVNKSVRSKMEDLGYPCSDLLSTITPQSREINAAVGNFDGAGDQGIIFGYAVGDTATKLPFGFELANKTIQYLEKITDHKTLMGDAKVLVVENANVPITDVDRIDSLNVSACIGRDADYHNTVIDLEGKLSSATGVPVDRIFVNPGGEWTFGGPAADCGLTGRKIVCDSYGGFAPVGGGAFSGKDFTKVDRTAAYMSRVIAKDVVEEFGFDTCLVQLGYMIGEAEPLSVRAVVNGKHWEYIDKYIRGKYYLTPNWMEYYMSIDVKKLPEISAGCHFRPVEFGGLG